MTPAEQAPVEDATTSDATAPDVTVPGAMAPLHVDEAELREIVETLAPYERLATSPGERRAAEWIARRLTQLGASAEVEDEDAHGSYCWPIGWLSALGALAGVAALRRRRRSGVLLGTLAAAGIADEVSGGPHLFRRLMMRTRTTCNVVAQAGDRGAPRTLVVLAHHDAARSGLVFHPAPQRRVWERFPGLVDRTDTSIPLWWPVVGGPALVAIGALLRSRAAIRLGVVTATGSAAAFADIGSRQVVPGANDNLSGVAALVGLARVLREREVSGVRVLLVSCGAEETLQEGIRAFARRHFPHLPRESTWFLNFETVGSPQLVLLEGEGPLRMEDYPGPFREQVAGWARDSGVALRRGLRSRNSTDGIVPRRAGYPTVTLVSVTPWKALANYHWPTDVPGNVDYETVAEAVRVGHAVAAALAEPPQGL